MRGAEGKGDAAGQHHVVFLCDTDIRLRRRHHIGLPAAIGRCEQTQAAVEVFAIIVAQQVQP